MKGSVLFFLHAVSCVGAHIQRPQPVEIQVGSIICWGGVKSGQGRTCWFESCPCRSSEGARDLFYIKAKIVEGLAWKCSSDFWPAVTLSCTVGTLQLPKWQYWFPPWKTLYLPCFFSICFAYRGRKSTASTLASLPSVHHKTGRMYFNTKHTNQNVTFKHTNIWMPKCVKTISVDAMHLFEINFNVAALLMLELVC